MTSMEDPVSAHLARVASLLAENANSTFQLAELRNAVSAAISNYSTVQVKHEYIESMLEVAANVWNTSLSLEDADLATDATLKQASLDLQWAALKNPLKLPLTHQLRLAEHAFKVAEIWGELDEWEAVDAALGRGLALSSALSAAAAGAGKAIDLEATTTKTTPQLPPSTQERCALVHFNSLLLRFRSSVRLGQELPANALLLKLKQATSSTASIPLRRRIMFSLDLLATLVFEGENLLEVGHNPTLSIQILQHAYDAYTSLSTATPELHAVGLVDDAQNLGARALILLCWAQIEHGSKTHASGLLVTANANTNNGISHESILNSILQLQKVNSRTAESVAVHFLAHQALQQAGCMQEAETELLKLVTHEAVTAETCAFAIKSALLAPGGAESARAALAAAQNLTSTDDVSLVIELIEAVLGPSCPSNKSLATTTTTAAAAPTTADEVILELLEDETLKESLEKDHKSMERIFILCWNRACSLSEAEEPSWAIKFYSAALLFINPTSDENATNEIQMALALCYNALGEYNKAFEQLNACSNGSSIEVAFAKYQTCLAAKDGDAAAAALKAIAAHPKCNNDVFRVLCCESLDAGLPNAAKDALLVLLEKLDCSKDGDVENLQPAAAEYEYEAVVFQNLIQLELDTINQQTNEEKSFDQLARLYELLVQRIANVGGAVNFIENDEVRQLEWMLATAWNAGIDASESNEKDTATSVRLMKSCGHLCAAHPAPDDEILTKQQFAFIAAAHALINVSQDAAFEAGSAATECLEKARAAAQQRDGEGFARENNKSTSKLNRLVDVLEFQLAVKQRNGEAASAVVERVKSIPTVSASPFLQMVAALEGENATHPCASARKTAMKAALDRLTSQPDLNYEAVAGVIRALLEICSSDADRLSTLQDAAALISATPTDNNNNNNNTATPAGGYPFLEARYLITAAWNRGATHSKFARMKDAEAFMGVALNILNAAIDSTENGKKQSGGGGGGGFTAEEKKMMFEEYARVQAAAVGSGGGGDVGKLS